DLGFDRPKQARPANQALYSTGPALRFFETTRSLQPARQVNAVVRPLLGKGAAMGYTHYWTWQEGPDERRLRGCLADMRQVRAAAPEVLAGREGEGDLAFEPARVCFNGAGEHAAETFDFPGVEGFNFCKTRYEPYDRVVTACLLAAHDHFPPQLLDIS